MIDRLDALERLAALLDGGKINQAEYELLKQQVLNNQMSEVPNSTSAREVSAPVIRSRLAQSTDLSVLGPSTSPSRTGRWWVAVALLVLGALGAVKNLVLRGGLPIEELLLSFLIDPLVWAGVIGLFLFPQKPERRMTLQDVQEEELRKKSLRGG